ERRDPGADALSELARLISEPDPPAPVPGRPDEAHKPGGRLADLSRGAPSLGAAAREPFIRPPAREPAQSQSRLREGRSYDDKSYEDRSSEDQFRQHQRFEGRSSLDRGIRRDPDFAPPRVPVQPTQADTDNPETPHASNDFDFLRLPDRDAYAVA